ncbi:MAG TPA: ABC transporter permease, partial [Tepidisphaeraceae bacterium]|nr:ABC transporter permease [Tepidisphaeraceae bacterium]
PRPGLFVPAGSLCKRELVRFLRQRHRIIGALLTPVVFWLLLGGGIGTSFQSSSLGGKNYISYFFPGTVLMILLFTAIFSTISVIEDRREGFLQSVLVAPVSRMAIVLGKVLGATFLAVGQGVVFLLLAPTVGVHFTVESFVLLLAITTIVAFALSSLGFCIAWRMTSTQGFHAIMNLFLLPLWFLSGALFPASSARGGLGWVMRLNPLSYGLDGIRTTLYLGQPGANLDYLFVCFVISIASAAALFLAAWWIARRTVEVNLH